MSTSRGQVSAFRLFRLRAVLGMALVAVCLPESAIGQESSDSHIDIEFDRDIRPILSNHCFQCHGADEESREAELRLDVRESAIANQAIDPDHLSSSKLLTRIKSTDAAERMPPADANKPLSEKQIQWLEQWVAEGAQYQDHWAFRKIERPQVANHAAAIPGGNEIDAFVQERLHATGLTLSAEADRATLIRRATQDVLGLLPTIEEADAFINDDSPNAWNNLVDRLLESPHYGERWGRHWLDQARYADSNGYTIDGPRIMWPYRDWVIAAINRDMPFDQFTIEQLAGDLLPNATTSQRVASAFHRNTMINEEGGVKPDQFRHEALIDRVNTTGAVWLGLTIGCAQCHSHKFDPIPHEEYYRMYAFFNAAVDANNAGETVDVRADEMFGWSDLQQEQLKELHLLREEKRALEKNATDQPPLVGLAWNWQPVKVTAIRASGSIILKINEDGTLLSKSDPQANDAFSITFQKPEEPKEGVAVTAIRLRTLTDPSLPSNGPGTAGNGNFILTDFALKAGGEERRFERAWADHSQPGYPVEHAIDDEENTGWAINVDAPQAAKGVKMNAPHEAIFALGEPIAFKDNVLVVSMRHDLNKNYLVGHFAIDYSTAPMQMDSPNSGSSKPLAEIKARIVALESLLPAKGASFRQIVMKDLEAPPDTYVLLRGDFLNPDRSHAALTPGVPEALNTNPATTAFSNRLDLGRWIVSRDNPLTARVTVNRIWAKYFGRGLVETENDFGYQGPPPTHPELLDWLAVELMDHGWSLKHLHRTILRSATYRQSSSLPQTTDGPVSAVDPENYLLSRQTRFRVEAEIVRDLAVAASGLFEARVGGPGIHLPQPDGIYDFTQNKKDWPTATGTDRYRRTMYTMFYRSAPYPLLSTFDAPDFSTVCTRRARSNTPLQSLTVANDNVFTELAAGLAAKTLANATLLTDEQRCLVMFRSCLTRQPESRELAVLQDFLSREMSRFHSAPDDAKKFVFRSDADAPAEVLAAWTSVARALFNTDEFLMRN